MKQKSTPLLFFFLFLAICYAQAQPKTSVKRRMIVADPIKLPVNLIKSGLVTVEGTIFQPDNKKKTIQFIADNAITNDQGIYVAKIDRTGKFRIQIPLISFTPNLIIKYGALYNSFIAYPGDVVRLAIDYSTNKDGKPKSKIVFSGSRAKLLSELQRYKLYKASFRNDVFYTNYEKNTKRLDPSNFKRVRCGIFKKDDSILRAFKKLEGSSASLYTLVRKENEFSYANDLVNFAIFNQNKQFNSSYFDFITPEFLNDPQGLLSADYPSFIKNYALYISLKTRMVDLPLIQSVPFALKNDTLLSDEGKKAFKIYIKNKGILNQEESKQFGKFMDNDFITQYHNAYLLNRDYNEIDSIFPDGLGKNLALSSMLYNKLMQNQILEDSVLYRFSKKINQKVIKNPIFKKNAELDLRIHKASTNTNFTGRILTATAKNALEELINKYKGKIIYLDFWATWCGPCLDQIEKAAEVKDRFKDVVFLYACVKSPEGRWKFLVQDKKVKGEHFLLSEDQFNYLSAEFAISEIPRYFLIDKQGKIVNDRAPYPSSPEFVRQVTNLER